MWVTAAQLRAFKIGGAVLDLSSFDDDELEAAILEAQALITGVTKRTFELSDDDVVKLFDGDGTTDLFYYPQYAGKIATASRVDLLEDGEIVYTYDSDDYVVRPFSMVLKDESRTLRVSRSAPGLWPVGIDNVKITGQWGEECPAAIARAVKLLSAEMLLPGSSGFAEDGVKRRKWEDYEEERQVTTGSTSTGFPGIDAIISQYIVHPGLFRTV